MDLKRADATASALYLYFDFANYSKWDLTLRAITRFACAVFCVALVSGCNSGPGLPATVPAEGTVILDGAPVADATIIFIADVGSYNASAVTDKEGKFAMKAFEEKKGAVPGAYKVSINKTIVESRDGRQGESDVNLKQGLPMKYSNFLTSGLTIQLGTNGDKNIKYELKSK